MKKLKVVKHNKLTRFVLEDSSCANCSNCREVGAAKAAADDVRIIWMVTVLSWRFLFVSLKFKLCLCQWSSSSRCVNHYPSEVLPMSVTKIANLKLNPKLKNVKCQILSNHHSKFLSWQSFQNNAVSNIAIMGEQNFKIINTLKLYNIILIIN